MRSALEKASPPVTNRACTAPATSAAATKPRMPLNVATNIRPLGGSACWQAYGRRGIRSSVATGKQPIDEAARETRRGEHVPERRQRIGHRAGIDADQQRNGRERCAAADDIE